MALTGRTAELRPLSVKRRTGEQQADGQTAKQRTHQGIIQLQDPVFESKSIVDATVVLLFSNMRYVRIPVGKQKGYFATEELP
jgi:hypothetical protein